MSMISLSWTRLSSKNWRFEVFLLVSFQPGSWEVCSLLPGSPPLVGLQFNNLLELVVLEVSRDYSRKRTVVRKLQLGAINSSYSFPLQNTFCDIPN